MPPLPDIHAIAVLLFTGFALYMFAREYLPVETTSLLVLATLVLGFQLFPYPGLAPKQFLQAFGDESLIAICALLILSQAVEVTGALQPLARLMAAGWQDHPQLSFLLVLTTGAFVSAFLNNTPIVVMTMPILVAVCLRNKTSPSAVLMPLGFAVRIGGMATTIGTSTNLLAVGIAASLGMPPIGMFDLTLPMLAAGIPGLLFLWLIAPRLVPGRQVPMSDVSPRLFHALLHVQPDGYVCGKTLMEARARTTNRMRVERIQRGDALSVARLPSIVLLEGDRLYVTDTAENLKEFETLLGATLYNASESEHPVSEELPLATASEQLAEVVITSTSPLNHGLLNVGEFVEEHNVLPLALHQARPKADSTGDLESTRLRTGDIILVQGSRDAIARLRASGNMLVLDGTTDLPHTARANRALGIMIVTVALAAGGVLPISISAVGGMLAMLLTGCLHWRDVGKALHVPVIMMIVCSVALGLALERTGAAEFLAQTFVMATSNWSTTMVLMGLLTAITLLTNVVSNNAAVAIGTPIAISVAIQLGVSPEPFVFAVIFGANMSFATPIAYQTNLLIMSAGGYNWSDFLRVGVPLTVIMLIAFAFILPVMYDL